MKDLLRKYHKYLAAFAIAILLVMIGSLYTLVRYSLPQTVRTIIQVTLGADIDSRSITFKKGGIIQVRDVTLKDDQELIVDAPLVEISYKLSQILRGRIEEIKVVNPEVWVTRDEDNNINIVDVFTGKGGEDDDDETEDEEPYLNEGSSVPIDRISIVDGYLYYKDTAYTEVIEKEASDVNGYVSCCKETGIELHFSGISKGLRGREELTFSYRDEYYPYEIGIKLKDVSLNDTLMQYAYKDETISYNDGVVDYLDLTITPDLFLGNGEFRDIAVNYQGLETEITDGAGKVDFAGEKIYVDADYMFGDEPGKISIAYKGTDGIDIDLYLEDILFEKLEAYDMLGELELPVGDMLFDSIHIGLVFDEEGDLKMDLEFYTPYYDAGKLHINELKGILYYEGGENFYLRNVEFEGEYEDSYIPFDFFAHIDARLTEDEGDLTYKIYSIESDTNIETISGDIDIKGIQARMDINTISGFIDVSLPADYNADLELSTITGGMYSDFEFDQEKSNGYHHYGRNELSKRLNNGGTRIFLETISGDIFIRKAK